MRSTSSMQKRGCARMSTVKRSGDRTPRARRASSMQVGFSRDAAVGRDPARPLAHLCKAVRGRAGRTCALHVQQHSVRFRPPLQLLARQKRRVAHLHRRVQPPPQVVSAYVAPSHPIPCEALGWVCIALSKSGHKPELRNRGRKENTSVQSVDPATGEQVPQPTQFHRWSAPNLAHKRTSATWRGST